MNFILRSAFFVWGNWSRIYACESDCVLLCRSMFLCLLLYYCFRRCGYIKAKQDPEEEKMQFQHGRGNACVIWVCIRNHFLNVVIEEKVQFVIYSPQTVRLSFISKHKKLEVCSVVFAIQLHLMSAGSFSFQIRSKTSHSMFSKPIYYSFLKTRLRFELSG